jgi:hypothetical protein
MSAELLRRAADEMHRDAQAFCDEDNAFYHAVANWLEAEAAIWQRLEVIRLELTKSGAGSLSWGESTQDEATAVALAYLGESA